MPAGIAQRLAAVEEWTEEVIDARQTTHGLERFERWRDDPTGFILDVLGADPTMFWKAQPDIARNVLENRRVVVRSANSIGKDWLAARLALWWVYSRGGTVLMTGPTERQVVEVLMRREAGRAFRKAKTLPGELLKGGLRIEGEPQAGILAFTSTSAGKLTGFHAPSVMVIITEGQDVEDFAYEGLLACATSEDSRTLVVGNPLRPMGRFYAVSRNAAWEAVKIPAADHPNVREGHEVVPGAVTAAWIQDIVDDYGTDSPIYEARVLAEFPTESVASLVTRDWLDEAAERFEARELHRDMHGERVAFVVDVARYGPDATAVATMQGGVVREIESWRGADLMETAGRIVQRAKDEEHFRRKKPKIVVDVIGMGSGVADRIREQGWSVSEFNSARSARDDERFRNTRAEAFWSLRDALSRGKIALPPDDDLFEELLAHEYEIGSDGRIRIRSKDEIRSTLGRSPDRADCIAMACWQRANRREAQIIRFRV